MPDVSAGRVTKSRQEAAMRADLGQVSGSYLARLMNCQTSDEVRFMNGTKARILDSAERLFAERGYTATTVRDITSEAEVNFAAVHYHFTRKIPCWSPC
jgi:Bacterial regulatory proteins, tetR family